MTEAIKPPIGLSLPGLQNIRSKFQTAAASLRGGEKQDNEALRRELIKVNTQFKQTQRIIQGDRVALTELAKSDERIAKLLALADDNKAQIISNKILDRAVVTQQEAALLIGTLKDSTGILAELDRTFKVSVGDVVRDMGSLVSDSRIDTESRRKIATDIAEFVEAQGQDAKELRDVLAKQPTSADFEANTEAISEVIDRAADQTLKIKTLTTLNNLNQTMDSAVLTQEELNETLEKQVAPGKSFEDFFKENPDAFSQGGIGGGLISQALGSVGLGGLEDILGPRIGRGLSRGLGGISGAFGRTRLGGLAARGIGGARALPGRAFGMAGRLGAGGLQMAGRGGIGAVGGIARGAGALGAGGLALGGRAAGGLLGGAGKALGGFAGLAGKAAGFAKFLGPLGVAIAVGKGIFDAVDGFNRAAEIAGLKEGEEATFGQKIQAAAASSLSGLTFGLLDEKEAFAGIGRIRDSITEGVTAVGDWAKKAWEDPLGGLTDALRATTKFMLTGGSIGVGIGLLGDLFGVDIRGWFNEKFGVVEDAIVGAFTAAKGFLTDAMADVIKFFNPEAIFKAVTEWGTGLAASIKDKISGFLSFLPGFDGGETTALGATTTPARVTQPPPVVLPEVPAGAGVDDSSLAEIKTLLQQTLGQRTPVPIKIDQVAAKPQLDRQTDIGDGFLGMLSTILDG